MTDQDQQQQAAAVHDQLAGRYLALTEQIEDLQQQRDGVKAAIRALIGAGTVETESGARITVTPNRRLSLERLRPMLTDQQVAECTIEILSNQLIKRYVAPDVVDACMVEVGEPVVRVS